jgi:type I restriction enzyme R subunit
MLEEHLDVTGLRTTCKLRNLTDPEFWKDFDRAKPPQELKTAAIRKSTELRKTIAEKVHENPHRYRPFSARLMEIIRKFDQGLIAAAEALDQLEQVARDLQAEATAHAATGLSEKAYGLYRIIQAFKVAEAGDGGHVAALVDHFTDAALRELTTKVDALYSSDQTAPPGWHLKEQLCKTLRQEVRRILHPSGLLNWKDLPGPIEEYALKAYLRV